MRIVMDYRPALRARSGVGEYVHQTARALMSHFSSESVTLFTSSWKDRPDPALTTVCPGAFVSDHRVPVSVLNLLWHRLEWPPIELLTHRRYDVAFSPHPLLLPSRDAARVVMVHDLDFLRYPERTEREIRRDYPSLAHTHARRASRVIVPSAYTCQDVMDHLGVEREHIVICPPGLPEWREPVRPRPVQGYVLFVGTLSARKNVGGLLTAYEHLIGRRPETPKLVVAGGAGPDAQPWLDRIARPPLAGRVEYRGYVAEHDRQRLYAGAAVLILPSFDEGFGLTVLESMSLGTPVIVANRGALPELVCDAGLLIDPEDNDSIAAALERILSDESLALALRQRGLDRATEFQWARTARAVRSALQDAVKSFTSPKPEGRSRLPRRSPESEGGTIEDNH